MRQILCPVVADQGLLLHEAALRLLRVLAGAVGALVTLEDLHWADAETLALVEYLADNVAAERLLCLATMRSDEPLPAPPLPARLVTRRNAPVLALERLSDTEVEAMARAALDAPSLPDGLGHLLASRAEGVPFLVEEVLASCVASGALVRARGVWELRTDRAPRVPETFQGMMRERLRSLGERDRLVLGAAAVLGRRFDWSLIPDAAGLDRGTVLSALRSAVNAQIVSPEDGAGGPAFRFRHALTRDAALEDLLPPERAELAARAAQATQRAHRGLPGPWCERAADLRELDGDRKAAARLLLESARRSLARTALASAESALDRARSLAGDDRDLTVEVDEALVEVLSLAGKPDRAVEAGERLVASLAHSDAPPGRAGKARLSLGRALAGAGAWDRALDELDEAARLARTADDDGLLAPVWSFRAQVEVWRGAYEAGIELAWSALAIAERLSLWEVACECLDVLGRRASVRDYQRGVEVFRRELEIAQRADLRLWKIRARVELGGIGAPLAYWNEASLDQSEAIALGRAGRARDGEAAAQRGAERLSRAHWLRCLHARLVAEAAIADRWGDPVEWLRQALPVLESAGHDRVVAACKALLRKAGAPVPRKGRGGSEVPTDLRSLGVTSREMDVLRLVADGLSNREIGARLFLSHRTVETHVASLQRRTRAGTRAGLVALASAVLAREGSD